MTARSLLCLCLLFCVLVNAKISHKVDRAKRVNSHMSVRNRQHAAAKAKGNEIVDKWFTEEQQKELAPMTETEMELLCVLMEAKVNELKPDFFASADITGNIYCKLHATCEQCQSAITHNCKWTYEDISALPACKLDEGKVTEREVDLVKRLRKTVVDHVLAQHRAGKEKVLSEIVVSSISSSIQSLPNPSDILNGMVNDLAYDTLANALELGDGAAAVFKGTKSAIVSVLGHLKLIPPITLFSAMEDKICAAWHEERRKRLAEIKSKASSFGSAAHDKLDACVKDLSNVAEISKTAIDVIAKPIGVVVNTGAAALKAAVNIPSTTLGLLMSPFHLFTGNPGKMLDAVKSFGGALTDTVTDLAEPTARIAADIVTLGTAEIAIAAVVVAKAGLSLFGIETSKFLACMLLIPPNDFNELMYLYEYHDKYDDSLPTASLGMEEPSRDELAVKILKKFSTAPKTEGNVASSLMSAGLSFAGIGGIPMEAFSSFADVTISTIGATADQAAAVVRNYMSENPDRKTALQRRIGGYLDQNSSPASLIFTPAGNTPAMAINAAGVALGPYFCEAAAFFKTTPKIEGCEILTRSLKTFIDMPAEVKEKLSKLHNPFDQFKFLELAKREQPSKQNIKTSKKQNNFRRKVTH